MESAKAAVKDFLHKDGRHDTTVHETVNPAVQQEHVTRTQHENVGTAVDREVHQHHHHTSVQPIQHREVLPEHHTHNQAEVEHRHIKHGDDSHIKERLAAEAAQFKNTRTVGETQHTSAAAPAVVGEHVHHHVHENIQPVVQKETIQPSVIHTTKPIHEVHQNEAKHHTATSLPPVTMDEFKQQGGSLAGREERTDAFAGEPRAVGGTLGGAGAHGTTSLTEKDGHAHTGHSHTGHSHGTAGHHSHSGVPEGTAGPHSSRVGNAADPRVDSDLDGSKHTGTTGHSTTTGTTGTTGHSTTTGTTGTTGHSTTTGTSTTHTKPSLLDKLNPKKDADGDGKAGFMK